MNVTRHCCFDFVWKRKHDSCDKARTGLSLTTTWSSNSLHSCSPPMSADNQSSSNVLPSREGALGPAEIRRLCPQFRILVIGKANAGKTTILRKVCNAKRDAKPIIYDAEGKEVIVKRDLVDVCYETLALLGQISNRLGSLWQVLRLHKVFGPRKGHFTDVLNPSAEVKQAITCSFLFLMID